MATKYPSVPCLIARTYLRGCRDEIPANRGCGTVCERIPTNTSDRAKSRWIRESGAIVVLSPPQATRSRSSEPPFRRARLVPIRSHLPTDVGDPDCQSIARRTHEPESREGDSLMWAGRTAEDTGISIKIQRGRSSPDRERGQVAPSAQGSSQTKTGVKEWSHAPIRAKR